MGMEGVDTVGLEISWNLEAVACAVRFGHILHNQSSTNDEFIAWRQALEARRHVLLHGTQ